MNEKTRYWMVEKLERRDLRLMREGFASIQRVMTTNYRFFPEADRKWISGQINAIDEALDVKVPSSE